MGSNGDNAFSTDLPRQIELFELAKFQEAVIGQQQLLIHFYQQYAEIIKRKTTSDAKRFNGLIEEVEKIEGNLSVHDRKGVPSMEKARLFPDFTPLQGISRNIYGSCKGYLEADNDLPETVQELKYMCLEQHKKFKQLLEVAEMMETEKAELEIALKSSKSDYEAVKSSLCSQLEAKDVELKQTRTEMYAMFQEQLIGNQSELQERAKKEANLLAKNAELEISNKFMIDQINRLKVAYAEREEQLEREEEKKSTLRK